MFSCSYSWMCVIEKQEKVRGDRIISIHISIQFSSFFFNFEALTDQQYV